MPSISLALPTAGSKVLAGPLASNFLALQTLLNGGLDGTNINQASALQIGASGLLIGADTNLYRPQANVLKTDDTFQAAVVSVGAGSANDISLWNDGKIYFGAASDTNLYRFAANVLRTDDVFFADKFGVQFGLANQILIENDGHIYFGSASDVNLYRAAADQLKTDDGFYAVGPSGLGWNGSSWALETFATGITIGASDTNLYRVAANTLKTDDNFQAAGNIWATGNVHTSAAFIARDGVGIYPVLVASRSTDTVDRLYIDNGGGMSWGPGNAALDTNLYRESADNLKTDDNFRVGKAIVLDNEGAGNALLFGNAQDVGMYRTAADELSMMAGDTFKLAAVGLKFNDGSIQTTAYAGGPAPATSLPGSPADKQIAILTDSTTAPTYAWTFQWSSTASKWFFIGGSPFNSAGTTFTTPRAGVYVVGFGALATVAVNVGSTIRLNKNSGTSLASLALTMSSTSGSVSGSEGGGHHGRYTLAASDTLVVDASAGSIGSAWLTVTPVYVT